MSRSDYHSPGEDIVDLGDVNEERQRILDALLDASEDLQCERITEKIQTEDYDGLADDVSEVDELLDAAGIDSNDVDFLRSALALEDEFGSTLAEVANNEPTMIHEAYFVEYAKQLAEDLGSIDRELAWPACHIDWESAAKDLSQDYTEVTYGGHSYLTRGY